MKPPRAGLGRPKGSRNKRTKAIEAKIAEAGLTPLEYLLGVLRDPNEATETRLEAAGRAAPYVHSKMPTNITSRTEIPAIMIYTPRRGVPPPDS